MLFKIWIYLKVSLAEQLSLIAAVELLAPLALEPRCDYVALHPEHSWTPKWELWQLLVLVLVWQPLHLLAWH